MTNYTELPNELLAVARALGELEPFTVREPDLHMEQSLARRICREASTAISTLERENRELREALEMAARTIEIINETMSEQGMGVSGNAVTVAQIARATLKGSEV